jgi:hypothetical protein
MFDCLGIHFYQLQLHNGKIPITHLCNQVKRHDEIEKGMKLIQNRK